MKFKRTAITLSLAGFVAAIPAFADGENPKFDKAKATAQAATDAGDFKKADTGWTKALAVLETAGEATPDANLELTLKRLAQANRQNGDYADGQTYLQRAIDTAAKIGMTDPELQTEANELSKYCRVIDPNKLGKDAAKLITDNKATIVVVKDKDEGNFVVTVSVPARIENTTGDDKVDQISMEKTVTLNLAESNDGTVQATNIKGFKIHVVEKKMWVNLLGVNFGKAKENGSRDAAITAGKMGVTKTVTQSIDANLYQPIAAFVDETKLFGTPVDVATTAAPAIPSSPAAPTAPSSTAAGSEPTSTTTSTTTSSGSTTTPAGSTTTSTMTNTTTTTTTPDATVTTTTTTGSTSTTPATTGSTDIPPASSDSSTSSSSTTSGTADLVVPATNGAAPSDGAPAATQQSSPSSVQKEAGATSVTSTKKHHDDDDADDDDDKKDKEKKKHDHDDDD